jgi:hypothetical protein
MAGRAGISRSTPTSTREHCATSLQVADVRTFGTLRALCQTLELSLEDMILFAGRPPATVERDVASR